MPCHVSNCIPFRESFHITQPIYHVISNVYILQTMRKLMLNNPLFLYLLYWRRSSLFIKKKQPQYVVNLKHHFGNVGYRKRRTGVEKQDPEEHTTLINDNQHNIKDSTSKGMIYLKITMSF